MIKLIHGRHGNGMVYTWRLNDADTAKVGDYAIVESCNRYALVEVVAIGATDEKYIKVLANNRAVNKWALVVIDREKVEAAKKKRG